MSAAACGPVPVFTTTEAAARLNIPNWRLARLVRSGVIPEPGLRVGLMRGWTPRDIDSARELLAGHDEENGKHA
jgi:hypothetical protein